MMQTYTGYKNPIAINIGYEGLLLSINCFRKKIRPRIDALMDTLVKLNDVNTQAKQEIREEIIRLTFNGETIQQVIDRMSGDGRTWAEIGDYLNLTTKIIFNREFK